jgi:hypothetical protein
VRVFHSALARPAALATSTTVALLGFAGDARADKELGAYAVRAGSEVAVYQDTDATTVVSPVVFAGVENVLGGWGVNGSMLVDVVSTASADIVATASSRWTELRFAPALSGHKRFDDVDVGLRAAVSSEPDYLSVAGGANVSMDLLHKSVTPTLSYDFAHDTLGRAGSPFSLFSRPIERHTASLAVSMLMSKATVFVPYVTGIVEIGDASKPYRFVPMFDPKEVPLVQPAMTAAEIDPLRLNVRPLEQLPTQRERLALGARVLHRFSESTVRFDERLYVDTWGLKAFTSDVRYYADVTPRLRLGGHFRFHAQTAVDFWQLAYAATMTSQGPRVPALRTEARELGRLYTPTEGLELRWGIDKHGTFALTFSADVAYTKFVDQLFIDHRVSVLGTTLFEMGFE